MRTHYATKLNNYRNTEAQTVVT